MLKGNRIILRAIEPEDLDLMYLIENDTQLWACGNSTVPYSRFALRQFIEQTQNDIHRDGQLRLVIQCMDGTAVGFVDLQNFEPLHGRAEVGIVLVAEAQGQGIAHEALTLLADYAKSCLHLQLLYAYVAKENQHAVHLFQHAGYVSRGILPAWIHQQDAHIFTLSL